MAYSPFGYNNGQGAPVMSNQYYGNYNNGPYQNNGMMPNNGYMNNGYPTQNAPMPPYQAPQSYQSPQQMQTGIAFINGQIEARAYPVQPGYRMYLFDTDGRTYYVKGVDFNGMPLPFKTYDFTEVVEPQLPAQSSYSGDAPVNMSDYIRRDEVENMIAAEVEKRLASMNGTRKKGGETGA